MSPSATRIVHYAWPEGLAILIEGRGRRTVARFTPRGWEEGDAAATFADGPPEGAEVATLDLPWWMTEQLPSLELAAGGMRTDFVRLPRLVDRLCKEGADAAVFVLGPVPTAMVISGGRAVIVEPAIPDGLPVAAALAAASGWIVIFAGLVELPAQVPSAVEEVAAAPSAAPRPEKVGPVIEAAAPAPATSSPPVEAVAPITEMPRPAAEGPAAEGPAVEAPAPAPPAPIEERFLVSPAAARSLPDAVAAELAGLAGDAADQIVGLLDGAHAVAEIAQATGLDREQVAAAVKVLVAHKLAFRYVSRARRPTGV